MSESVGTAAHRRQADRRDDRIIREVIAEHLEIPLAQIGNLMVIGDARFAIVADCNRLLGLNLPDTAIADPATDTAKIIGGYMQLRDPQ